MNWVTGTAVALLLVFAAGPTSAGETQGTVRSLDTRARIVTLQDGTRLLVAEGLSLYGLKEGVSVRVTYETRDGDRIATSIEAE